MSSPKAKVSRMKLKRCERSQDCKANILSKISCKIGDHYVSAYINTGSSISIASTDLYRILLDDKCSFKEGKGTLHEIDDSFPNQKFRITSTNVKVIGRTKSINLVTFPNIFIKKTTLGMDFLTTKSKAEYKENALKKVPKKLVPSPEEVLPEQSDDQPVDLLDWISNPNSLKKPLYNILAEGTADDDDLFAICAFMKRLPRPVSPIKHLEKPRAKQSKKLVDAKLAKTPVFKIPVVPVTSTTSK